MCPLDRLKKVRYFIGQTRVRSGESVHMDLQVMEIYREKRGSLLIVNKGHTRASHHLISPAGSEIDCAILGGKGRGLRICL